MGRGTILADLGEGQYTIKLDFGESRLAAQLLLLTGANSDLDTQITAQQVKVNAAQAALNASNAALAVAIDAYVVGNSSPNLLPPIETAKLDQVAKEEALRVETLAIGELQSTKANNLRKISDLNSYRASLTLNAWCADYTEGASGQVATLEIPNEPKTVLIAPTGRAPVDADGDLRMRALMTAPQAYYNAAILPGWQKFKPTYRSGTITVINGDTADVTLNEAKSSASGISDIGLANIEFNVNQTSTLTNVPIVYQDCNGAAFEVGDSVVVQFMSQNWSNPQIIGFLSNPKACNIGAFFNTGKVLPTSEENIPAPGIAPSYFGAAGVRYQAKPEPSQTKFSSWYGGDAVWFGAGRCVSWRVEGDPYNFPYVVYNNTVIDCANNDFYNWYNATPDTYWYNHHDWHVCGAAVYGQFLYFCIWNFVQVLNETSGYYDITENLFFYRKNLVTNEFEKVDEILNFVGSITTDENDVLLAPYATGNQFVHITDRKNGPILSPAGKRINLAEGGYCFKVSFHPKEIKAIFPYMNNWQYGYMQWESNTTKTFTPMNGLVAAEYHPEDGRICTLTLSNYSFDAETGTGPTFFRGYGAEFTATFSEGGSLISGTPRRFFVGQLNVCYPTNNVIVSREKKRFQLITNPSGQLVPDYSTVAGYSRDFFSGAFTESFAQDPDLGHYTDETQFSLLEHRPANTYEAGAILGNSRIYVWVRVVYAKEKYYCVYYTALDSTVGGKPSRIISSEFTQAEIQSETGYNFSFLDTTGSTGGLANYRPSRIGFTSD